MKLAHVAGHSYRRWQSYDGCNELTTMSLAAAFFLAVRRAKDLGCRKSVNHSVKLCDERSSPYRHAAVSAPMNAARTPTPLPPSWHIHLRRRYQQTCCKCTLAFRRRPPCRISNQTFPRRPAAPAETIGASRARDRFQSSHVDDAREFFLFWFVSTKRSAPTKSTNK